MSKLRSGRQNEAFYKTLWNTLVEEGRWQGEIWNRHKSGRIFPEWLSIVKIERKDTLLYMGVFVDISQNKEQEEYIKHLAYYDNLTGIANRTLFYDHLNLAVQQAQHRDNSVAVLLIDLDRFKLINDSLGMKTADKLLIHVAGLLRSLIYSGDSVARLNSDEFALLLNDVEGSHQQVLNVVMEFAHKIKKELAKPFLLGNEELLTTCTIGITLFPHDTEQSKELLKYANIAMQQGKKEGGNTIICFQPPMLSLGLQRFNIEHALQRAIKNEELLLHYQPQLDPRGAVIGAECLLRWNSPQGWISPAEFIPIAEESGLILDIGAWVLTTACKQLHEWEKNGMMQPGGFRYLAVNISPRQFMQRQFIQQLEGIIKTSGLLDLSKLELELTESCLVNNTMTTVHLVNQLHNMAIRLSIDDFGTGYSSLAYLKDFELDTLKIDQSFVKTCIENHKNAAIIRTIILMAQSLGLSTIAEGVETDAQRQFLMKNDCGCFQGYYFSKPLPLADFEQFVKQTNALSSAHYKG